MRCGYIESVDNILKYSLVVKGKTVIVRLLGRMTGEEIFFKVNSVLSMYKCWWEKANGEGEIVEEDRGMRK